jgi:hypothetical protein
MVKISDPARGRKREVILRVRGYVKRLVSRVRRSSVMIIFVI